MFVPNIPIIFDNWHISLFFILFPLIIGQKMLLREFFWKGRPEVLLFEMLKICFGNGQSFHSTDGILLCQGEKRNL